MGASLTKDLGRLIAGLRYSDIPADAVPLVKNAFVDCIAAMLAGSHEDAPKLLESALPLAPGGARILFSDRKVAAPDAALINGTAAHVLDYDDFAARLGGHPSAVLVPAILAQADAMGASGEQMIRAYAAGFETWYELVRREPASHHEKGWHPTGVFGAVGAAAACAALRKLDATHASHAIALGASQSGGIMANFGSMAKSLHAGNAARAGVVSAMLAEQGFTAARDALESRTGLLAALSPAGAVDLDTDMLTGSSWQLLNNRLSIKQYPLCFAVQRAIDGMLQLIGHTNMDAARVQRVEVSLSRRNATLVLRHHQPQTALEAKFSMEFAMACALIARRAGLRELSDAFVRRPDVQALMKRVVLTPLGDDQLDPQQPGFSLYDRVVIRTDRGETLDSGPIRVARGSPDNPLSTQELWHKFDDCLSAGRSALPARALFDALMSLEHVPDFSAVPQTAAVSAMP